MAKPSFSPFQPSRQVGNNCRRQYAEDGNYNQNLNQAQTLHIPSSPRAVAKVLPSPFRMLQYILNHGYNILINLRIVPANVFSKANVIAAPDALGDGDALDKN